MTGLEGKMAVVAGGAGSIGVAIIERLLDEGCRCACVDANGEKLVALEERHSGDRLLTLAADLTEESEVERVFRSAEERFGGPDLLVNAAGILGPTAPVAELDADAFETLIRVNVRIPFLTLRTMLRSLHRRSAPGAVVNFSSTATRRVRAGRSLYAMSKRAIEAMSVAAAAENFDKGIRINCVAPGPIDSDMYRLITVNEPAALKGAAVGQPEDVAALVAFLLSDEARHCSGHTYFVDGGVAA